MMDNEDIKTITRALCIMSLTLIINLIFVHMVIYAAPSAVGQEIEALDAMGREVIFDGDGHAVNAGPVRFRFNEDRLDRGEMFLFDDDSGSTLNPVENGEYDLFPGDGDGTVSFYKKYSDGDGVRLIASYHVSFTDGIYDVPRALLTECEEGLRLEVYPLDHTHVYCGITGAKNGEVEEITERTEFLLDRDGVYRFSVYSEDGMGHRTYADLPSEAVLDKTAPVISAGACEITDDKLSMMISASDELTGVSYVTISNGEKTLYRGTGVREKAVIDISRLPYGIRKYEITATDGAGNTARDSFTVEKKDGKVPELTLEGASDRGVYGKDITIHMEVSDDSGDDCTLKETVTRYDLSGKYDGEERYDKRDLTFTTSGIYIIRAEASDKAGNTARRSLAFAIDRKSPVIRGLLGLNGSTLKSFMMKEGGAAADDDSMVQVRMIMNGVDYNGEKLTKSGKYKLQVLATDEFGNSRTEDASFEIRK